MFINSLQKDMGEVPEIMYLFAFNPKATRHLAAFTQEIMRGESDLPVGLREFLAEETSRANQCDF